MKMNFKISNFSAILLAAVVGSSLLGPIARAVVPADSRAPLSRWVQVQGSVTYLQRIGLPRGAKLKIFIEDTRLADAPAKRIATRVYPVTAVPKRFAIRITRDAALDENQLSLRASITDSRGKLWFTSTSHISVRQDPFSNYIDVGEVVLESAR